jgi:uncharacterized membrane protein
MGVAVRQLDLVVRMAGMASSMMLVIVGVLSMVVAIVIMLFVAARTRDGVSRRNRSRAAPHKTIAQAFSQGANTAHV